MAQQNESAYKDTTYLSWKWSVLLSCLINMGFVIYFYVKQFDILAPSQHTFFILAAIVFLLGAVFAYFDSCVGLVLVVLSLIGLFIFSFFLNFKSYSMLMHLLSTAFILLHAIYICTRQRRRRTEEV